MKRMIHTKNVMKLVKIVMKEEMKQFIIAKIVLIIMFISKNFYSS